MAEWQSNNKLTELNFIDRNNIAAQCTNPIIELSKNIYRRIDNICSEFIKAYDISIQDWKENTLCVRKPSTEQSMSYFPIMHGEIRYKDITVCAYGPDPVEPNCFLISESWKIHKDYNDLILKGAKTDTQNLFNKDNKPFIFRSGL